MKKKNISVDAETYRPGNPPSPHALNITHHNVELGGMTKNVYHGIFLNYTGFTVYGGIFYFFHT